MLARYPYGYIHTGQAYVALSRAKTLDGIQVVGYHPKTVSTSQSLPGRELTVTAYVPVGQGPS